VLLAFNHDDRDGEGVGSRSRSLVPRHPGTISAEKKKATHKRKEKERTAHAAAKKSGTWSSFMSGAFPPPRQQIDGGQTSKGGDGRGGGRGGGGGMLDESLLTPPASDAGSDYGTPPASDTDASTPSDDDSNSLTRLVAATRKKPSASPAHATVYTSGGMNTSGGMIGGTPGRKAKARSSSNENQSGETPDLGALANVTSMETTYTSFSRPMGGRGREISGESFDASATASL
jgi:hypothetical protein